MTTKEHISELKKQGNGAIKTLINKQKNSKEIVYILENLGYLPQTFDTEWMPTYLTHKNKDVRLWTVKTLGKIKKEENAELLFNLFEKENTTEVKREIVSSIGRMRLNTSVNGLFDILNDKDPKIVVQAIRALLVFKGEKEVDKKLKHLINHKNEMISSIIYKEYFSKEDINITTQKHSESYEFLRNKVILGDTRDVLREIPDESFHLTFTSPPYYNARDYSIYESYQEYLDFLEEVFSLTYQKTKEGRFLIVNTSPIIIPRISRQHSSKRYPIPFDIHHFLVKMGWEFIDDIIWMKPESSVKNRIGGFMQHRKPLAYKPNSVTEYLMVYRKKTSKLLDWNMKQYDKSIVDESKVNGDYESSNVWQISPKYDKVHSAVFPVELCKRVIMYYSYKGDLVFDPFGGSGTFGRTAKDLERYFFLTEKESKYFEYMKTFLKKDTLFNEKATEFLELSEFIKKRKGSK